MVDYECYGPGSIAGAIIGTFFVTCIILVVATLLYRKWRRNKGKHLVLVTDPEIVEEAYAFDNPCFRDMTPGTGRTMTDRPMSMVQVETPNNNKESSKWLSPLASLGLGSGAKVDKRRTLDDSCIGPKAKTVSIVGLKSRDFTGLGFNVCGNMREGIFVKDLLHRGPASESGRIHPGDRISSVKISFRSMVYEDALTILSYASPYDVELEVESGGTGSKPTTLLKKSIGPNPNRICHPLFRSQSIPELSRAKKAVSKRLFLTDHNDSNYSTMKSTMKSSKSTPGVQTLERHHEEKTSQHLKFGIKVLPALDGTVHRIENQNEHNTNLERRNSKNKVDVDSKNAANSMHNLEKSTRPMVIENVQKRSSELPKVLEKKVIIPEKFDTNGIDVPDRANSSESRMTQLPTEVPTEVHNAAMAARRNRRSVTEIQAVDLSQSQEVHDSSVDAKNPHKNKRKAPAPPAKLSQEDEIQQVPNKTEENEAAKSDERPFEKVNVESVHGTTSNRRNSESDTDTEIPNSFTMIELNSAHITVHHTPIPDEEEDEDDVYRKAASLGDLSKYENKASAMLERAQSLDMSDSASKKRKAPMPPQEDIHESTEDLTKLDQIEAFERTRKLKKSSEWGNLENAIWSGPEVSLDEMVKSHQVAGMTELPVQAEKSNETENEFNEDGEQKQEKEEDKGNLSEEEETSLELYNLPLSKKLTKEFIDNERLFDLNADNALAWIVNDGEIVKSLTPEQIEEDFRKSHPPTFEDKAETDEADDVGTERDSSFEKAVRMFDLHSKSSPVSNGTTVDIESPREIYAGMEEVSEKPISKITLNFICPGCENGHGKHNDHCMRNPDKKDDKDSPAKLSYHQTIKVEDMTAKVESEIEPKDKSNDSYETYFAKPIMNIPDDKDEENTNENVSKSEESEVYDFSPKIISVNSKKKPIPDNNKRHNVSSISVSSSESFDDGRTVREPIEFNDTKPFVPITPMAIAALPKKMTYITEIKVTNNTDSLNNTENEDNPISILESRRSSEESSITTNGKLPKPPVPPRRSDATKYTKAEKGPERQVVYLSEFRTTPMKESPEVKEGENKKFENWVYLNDSTSNKEQNSWSNGDSTSPTVTSIVLSLGDDKIVKK